MHTKKPFPDPADAHALLNEADIGSGEKTPADRETEEMIREIPPLPDNEDAQADETGAPRARREHDDSLSRDEPSDELDELDPVPPEGNSA